MAFTLGFNKFLSKQFSQESTQPRDGLLASELTCKNRNNMHTQRHRLGMDHSTKMRLQEEERVLVCKLQDHPKALNKQHLHSLDGWKD